MSKQLPDFTIGQGDSYPPYRARLKNADGTYIDLSGGGTTVTFRAMNRDTKVHAFDGTATIVAAGDASGLTENEVDYYWGASDTATPGDYDCAFIVLVSGTHQETVPTDDYLWLRISPKP